MKWAKDEFTGRHFGKYEVLCRLAVGGMAEIFLAFPLSGDHVGQPVVLKRILNEQREDEHALQMLLDEAKLTATLNHPNVARVIDLEVAGEDVLLVIEFIAGANMEEIVSAFTEQGEVVPLGFALTVVREAAQGLAHAHSHIDAKGRPTPIVHRDVTPRNIMVNFDGVTKMLDFGIARAMGSARRTVAGMVRGTTAYMSPEQAVGKDVNPQSDIFSLGVIFHELLTGQRLFSRGNPGEEMAAVYESEIPLPSKVNRRVPKTLDTVVMRALERARDKRYQNGLDLIRDLSLTAGSTAWSYDRCAEAVRERFSGRQRDTQKLISLIPAADLAPRPSAPEPRTLIAQFSMKTGLPSSPFTDEREGLKTVIGTGPLGAALVRTDPEREGVERKPGKKAALDSVPLADTRVSSRPLPPGADLDDTHERVLTDSDPERQAVDRQPFEAEPDDANDADAEPASSETLGDAEPVADEAPAKAPPDDDDAPTTPRGRSSNSGVKKKRPGESSVRKSKAKPAEAKSSSGVMVAVALVAIVLGVAGGVMLSKNWVPADATPTLGRLSIKADRPAQVVLGGQKLGSTPVSGVLLPVGRHQLQLKEPTGQTHSVEVVVTANQETALEVVLDSLP